jgi:flagellar basal-body rod protein FlgG
MLDVAANNLANLNSSGYKSSRVHLGTLGSNTAAQGEIGRGVHLLSIERNSQSGPLISTGVPYDLALQGPGFFQNWQNGGLTYTRDGAFHLDKEGYLVDAAGNRLQPEIQLPPEATALRIDPSGRLTALDAAGRVVFSADLTIQTFPNPGGLASLGHNDFGATTASGPGSTVIPGTAGAGTILQGFLEGSNVDPAREMVSLILGQRGFEANLKTIQTADSLLGEIINLRA